MRTRLTWTNRFCIWRYDPQWPTKVTKPRKSAGCRTSNSRYQNLMADALKQARKLNWAAIAKPFEIIVSNGDDEPMLPKLPSLATHRLPMVRSALLRINRLLCPDVLCPLPCVKALAYICLGTQVCHWRGAQFSRASTLHGTQHMWHTRMPIPRLRQRLTLITTRRNGTLLG